MLKLPDEILVTIFDYLSFNDLLKAANTCKKWNLLTAHNYVWHKFIENKYTEGSFKESYKRNVFARKNNVSLPGDVFYMTGNPIHFYEYITLPEYRYDYYHYKYRGKLSQDAFYFPSHPRENYVCKYPREITKTDILNSFEQRSNVVELFTKRSQARMVGDLISSNTCKSPIFKVRLRPFTPYLKKVLSDQSGFEYIEAHKNFVILECAFYEQSQFHNLNKDTDSVSFTSLTNCSVI